MIVDLNFNVLMLYTLATISLKLKEKASHWIAPQLSFSLVSYPPPPQTVSQIGARLGLNVVELKPGHFEIVSSSYDDNHFPTQISYSSIKSNNSV